MTKKWKDVRKGDVVALKITNLVIIEKMAVMSFKGIDNAGIDIESGWTEADPDEQVEVLSPYDDTVLDEAVRACCTCGGGGPEDPHTCPACMVFHYIVTGVRK